MTRVLHVVTSTDRRGAEVFGTQLSEALGQRGWDSRAVALAPGLLHPRLEVEALGPSPLAPATLRALRRAAGGRLVVAHGSTTLAACGLATLVKAPFVYRSIGDPAYWAPAGLRRARFRLLLGRARTVVALSEGLAGVLHQSFGVHRRRLAVIPNGVPEGEFPLPDAAARASARAGLGLAGTSSVVACVGALSAEKDVGVAVDAVAGIAAAALVVVGDGPCRAALEDQAARVAPGRVVFAAGTPVRTALAAADALVLPSRTEGMPAVLIEAAFCAVPAVATQVGAVADVVVDGSTGRLVAPGDGPGLAAALAEVLADPVALGARAREHCLARFRLDAVADQWHALLTSLDR